MKIYLTNTFAVYAICIFFLFLLTGCIASKKCAYPFPFPEEAINSKAEDALQDPLFIESDVPKEWWLLFNDPQLSRLIESAFKNNPTLHEARAQIYASLYAAQQVRSSLFPQINWGGDILREKLSETGLIPFNMDSTQTGANAPFPTPTGNGIPVYFTQYETEFTLAYDFDIWEKRRNTYRAALGEVQARIADDAFLHLQLGVALAKTYFDLQVAYQREKIAKALVQNQKELQKLTKTLLQKNLRSGLNVSNADSLVSDALVNQTEIESAIALKEYQLKAYLAGTFEECIVDASLFLPKVPLPSHIPMHLLANRPDIQRELWLIQSAGKLIETAKAGFYPDFNITALFGFQTIHLHKLFNWPSSFYNVDPAFTLPLFTGGLLEANLDTSEVNYDIAIYRYNQLIVDAAKEVLESIALIRLGEKKRQELIAKLSYQERYQALTNVRFQNNLESRVGLLQSEQSVLMAKDQEIIALGNILQAILSLIKALGGGYNAPE